MDGSDYLELVRKVPCQNHVLLGTPQTTPTYAHHPRDGAGISQRGGDFCAIALCWDCHQGPQGIHGDRTLLRMTKATEWDLHDMTNQAVLTDLVNSALPF